MNKQNAFKDLILKGNIVECYFDSWDQFNIYFLNNLLNQEEFVWRGHRKKDWTLTSTFIRNLGDEDLLFEEINSILDTHLDIFRMNCRGQSSTLEISRNNNSIYLGLENKLKFYDNKFKTLEKNIEKIKENTQLFSQDLDFDIDQPLKSFDNLKEKFTNELVFNNSNTNVYDEIQKIKIQYDNEWWAIGQHFGLNTPLLDWTYSMYIAAYFAFIDFDNSDISNGNRVLIAMDKSKVTDLNMDDKITIIDSYSYNNSRLLNQRGIFTKGPLMSSMEKWAENNDIKSLIYKFYIPENQRERILKHLERMNIHPGTIFPDLSGVAKYINLKSTIENY